MLNKQWIRASEQEQIDLLLAAQQFILHHKWGCKGEKRMKKNTMSTAVKAALFHIIVKYS